MTNKQPSWDLSPGSSGPQPLPLPTRRHCLILGEVTGVTLLSILVAVAFGSEDGVVWRLEVRDEDH